MIDVERPKCIQEGCLTLAPNHGVRKDGSIIYAKLCSRHQSMKAGNYLYGALRNEFKGSKTALPISPKPHHRQYYIKAEQQINRCQFRMLTVLDICTQLINGQIGMQSHHYFYRKLLNFI